MPAAVEVNNHVHTNYSFSPYSPSAAVYAARAEGLATCGIVDHDSIGGAREFIEAGKIVGIPTTIGIETRVSFAETPLADKRTNNPDQIGNSYMVLHAVPHANIKTVQAHFAPLRAKRNERNRKMVARINERYAADGVSLDFERDVLPLSQSANGGSVTERHLMLALARRENPHMGMMDEFRRVGELKKDFIPKVYEDADAIFVQAELPGLRLEDVSVGVENDVLTLSGERKSGLSSVRSACHAPGRASRARFSVEAGISVGVTRMPPPMSGM